MIDPILICLLLCSGIQGGRVPHQPPPPNKILLGAGRSKRENDLLESGLVPLLFLSTEFLLPDGCGRYCGGRHQVIMHYTVFERGGGGRGGGGRGGGGGAAGRLVSRSKEGRLALTYLGEGDFTLQSLSSKIQKCCISWETIVSPQKRLLVD